MTCSCLIGSDLKACVVTQNLYARQTIKFSNWAASRSSTISRLFWGKRGVRSAIKEGGAQRFIIGLSAL